MALTKVSRGLISTSIVDNGNATAITIDSSENVTFAGDGTFSGTLHAPGGGNIATNEAFGTDALVNNTTGSVNTAIGYQSLHLNTEGYYNTAVGYQALYTNTTSGYNTAYGIQSLYSNTDGYNNVALGLQALYSNTTGKFNTASGGGSLMWNTEGESNTANGDNALYSNTTGNYNTASGNQALRSNTTGTGNIGIGYGAGDNITTGSNNTIIGDYAGTAALEGTIVLAAGAVERLRIDASGNLGIGVTPSYKLDVSGSPGDVVRFTGDANNSMRAYLGSGYQIFQCVNSGTTNQVGYASGNFYVQTASTTRMTIDTSGKLLVNGATANAQLAVKAPAGIRAMSLQVAADGNSAISFANAAGTDVGYIQTDAAGIGIYLGGSAAANLLDDYEEGAWAPNIIRNGGSIAATFTAYNSTYVKIGNIVYVKTFIHTMSNGSSDGSDYWRMNGMPFAGSVESYTGVALAYNSSPADNCYVGDAGGNAILCVGATPYYGAISGAFMLSFTYRVN